MSELALGATVVGRYRVKRKLGAGGMGAVYLAEPTGGGEDVVVKTLLASWAANPSSRKRFAREAEAAARLSHPGIVRILEYDAEAETPYLVMERVAGQTLTELIRAPGPMDVGRTTGLLRQLLSALDTAHRDGIVHRDLKPANIMVWRDVDGTERLKVLDFGLARILDEERRTRLTRTGQILGTPGFLAPEQAKGDPIDARTDLWAVAVIAYVMLSEHLPFPGKDTGERILNMLTAAPVALSHHRPDVSDAISGVVLRGLEKEPNDRYGSAAELSAAFDAALSGVGPVTAATVPGRPLRAPETMPDTPALVPPTAVGVPNTEAAVVPEAPVVATSATGGPSSSRGLWTLAMVIMTLAVLAGVGAGSYFAYVIIDSREPTQGLEVAYADREVEPEPMAVTPVDLAPKPTPSPSPAPTPTPSPSPTPTPSPSPSPSPSVPVPPSARASDSGGEPSAEAAAAPHHAHYDSSGHFAR